MRCLLISYDIIKYSESYTMLDKQPWSIIQKQEKDMKY